MATQPILSTTTRVLIGVFGIAFCCGVWTGWCTWSVASAFGPYWVQKTVGDIVEWEWEVIHKRIDRRDPDFRPAK